MFALLLFVFVACGGFLGCETGYTNGTGVGLTGSFTGLYANPTGGVLVASSTGTFVSYLKLTQSGTDVNAVDNKRDSLRRHVERGEQHQCHRDLAREDDGGRGGEHHGQPDGLRLQRHHVGHVD